MLDDSGSVDEDLEPIIVGWETFQENQYGACDVPFFNSNCKMNSMRRLGKSEGEWRFFHSVWCIKVDQV